MENEFVDEFEDDNLLADLDELKLQELNQLKENSDKLDIIRTMSKDEIKLQEIQKFKDEIDIKNALIEFRKEKLFNPDFILKNIDRFIENEYQGTNIDAVKETIARMYEKNNSIVQNVDFRILDEKYLNLLGEDKINLISKNKSL